jgi:plasmid maintenance system antidote protein VapI
MTMRSFGDKLSPAQKKPEKPGDFVRKRLKSPKNPLLSPTDPPATDAGRVAGTARVQGLPFRVIPLHVLERRFASMATGGKSLTKSEIASQLAEKVGVSKKQVTLLLQAQAELAYKQAKNVYTIPGIGKLKLVDRPARKMIMRFGPNAGQE